MNNIHGLGSSSNRGSGGGGGGQGAADSGCKGQCMAMWQSTPLFNRFILITCILIYLVSWVFPAILTWTMLSPVLIMHAHRKQTIFNYAFIMI